MQEQLMAVIKMLHMTWSLMNLQTSKKRNKTDIFVSRVVKNINRENLSKFMDDLIIDLKVNIGFLKHQEYRDFLKVAHSEHADSILAFIRTYPNEVSSAAAMSPEHYDEVKDIFSLIDIPKIKANKGRAYPPSKPYDIPITFRTVSPLAHGSDQTVGNSMLFRRTEVLSDTGATLNLPYFSGNAFRGKMRRLLAAHYLDSIGLKPNKSKPPVELWFFYSLYSGGMLDQSKKVIKDMDSKALEKLLGASGSTKLDGITEFRNMVLPLSVLGSAVGTRIIEGRIMASDFRPRCYEWGTGDIPAESLFRWTFGTKREDYEKHEENSSMIYDTEVVREGAVFDGGIDLRGHTIDIEKSCLGRGLQLMIDEGYVGGASRTGFGRIDLQIENLPSPAKYDTYLADHKDVILDYLKTIKAVK